MNHGLWIMNDRPCDRYPSPPALKIEKLKIVTRLGSIQ